jgi:hypothetical protein
MARAHLDTKGYDHMWKDLRSKSIRALESYILAKDYE